MIDGAKLIKGSDAPSRARRVIRQGDVILATVRPYLCGHAVVPESLDNQICSTGFAVLRCPDDINPQFLYYMLIAPQTISQFHTAMRGAHYPALNDAHVHSLRIPRLAKSEQDRIVEQLEDIVDQLQAGALAVEAFAQRVVADAQMAIPALLADVYGRESGM